ncbi:MAG: MraY family glycosyltransferase [Candidatus Dojkabacteria bacterium]|nr:MraY family glycosyltransferase [Candidatus Dojkabacteria bacterium]MDQ7021157.1 MraY family glycosyltransferase [Candidatus Dojkabacteria bacterium]
MGLFDNEFIRSNFETLAVSFIIAFLITFITTPLVGRLAKSLGMIDLPASMRKQNDSSKSSRINKEPKIKFGGFAIFLGFIGALYFTDNINGLNLGILLGLFVILLFGIIDDKFDPSGKVTLLGQLIAAFIIVIGGISVTQISLYSHSIDLNWFSAVIDTSILSYNFIFPADFMTILWIVGIMNFVNWVGGVDDLNSVVTMIIATTMAILALNSNNIAFATIAIAHVGALNGYIPFNYNPSKIIQGGTGDFLNGYLLAVFAIIGGTRWSSSFILLALPIIDALLVIFMRFKSHPEIIRNPLKILTISDKNHLHHRLMDAGYSRKLVLLIESAIMLMISSIAIYFSNIRSDFRAIIVTITLIFVAFTVVTYLRKRNIRNNALKVAFNDDEIQVEATVKVVIEGEDEDEKFIY